MKLSWFSKKNPNQTNKNQKTKPITKFDDYLFHTEGLLDTTQEKKGNQISVWSSKLFEAERGLQQMDRMTRFWVNFKAVWIIF